MTKILVTYAVFAVIWYVFQALGCMLIFKKTGTSKATAFIPLVREKALFDISVKNAKLGLTWLVLAVAGLACFLAGCFAKIQIVAWIGVVAIVVAVVLSIYRNFKEAKAFGRDIGTGLVLTLIAPLGNIMLGKGDAEYRGKI